MTHPTQVTLIPQYIFFFKLKLIPDVPLTIGAWLAAVRFTIFLLRQFIMSIPRDLDEAAVIDWGIPHYGAVEGAAASDETGADHRRHSGIYECVE